MPTNTINSNTKHAVHFEANKVNMDDKHSMSTMPPCTRMTTSPPKIPSAIDVSGSQEGPDDGAHHQSDSKEKHSRIPRKLDQNDDCENPAIGEAHSSMKDSDIVSSLSESSDAQVQDPTNGSDIQGGSSADMLEDDSDENTIDQLRNENENLIIENEQLRRLIEAIKKEREKE